MALSWHKQMHRLFFTLLCALLLEGCALPFAPKPDFVASPVDMPFVFVKGGEFTMGSDARANSQPVHKATVKDLFVGMYEVTFEQYDKYCEATGGEKPDDANWGRDNRPAINVSWNDANVFAAWLSRETGQTYRLPSETEWEYFTRAGTTTPYWTGNTLPKGAENCRNCLETGSAQTMPVGSFSPNPWKLFDTLGNVQEWVLDDYKEDYNDFPIDGSPFLTTKKADKSIRGGAWVYDSGDGDASMRDYNVSRSVSNSVGFRLVLIPPVSK